jgi:hypothetical protein
MSTTALDTQDTTGTAGRHAGGLRVTFPRVVTMEWIKLRSLRSTLYTLTITVALVIGLGLLFSSLVGSGQGPGEDDFSDPTSISLGGVMLASLAVAVLGVLMSAGEYASGSIRATLAAVPSRLPVLWGKVIVFAVVSFVLMFAAALGGLSGRSVGPVVPRHGHRRALRPGRVPRSCRRRGLPHRCGRARSRPRGRRQFPGRSGTRRPFPPRCASAAARSRTTGRHRHVGRVRHGPVPDRRSREAGMTVRVLPTTRRSSVPASA